MSATRLRVFPPDHLGSGEVVGLSFSHCLFSKFQWPQHAALLSGHSTIAVTHPRLSSNLLRVKSLKERPRSQGQTHFTDSCFYGCQITLKNDAPRAKACSLGDSFKPFMFLPCYFYKAMRLFHL